MMYAGFPSLACGARTAMSHVSGFNCMSTFFRDPLERVRVPLKGFQVPFGLLAKALLGPSSSKY